MSGAEYSQYLTNTWCLYSIRPPSPSLTMFCTQQEAVSATAGKQTGHSEFQSSIAPAEKGGRWIFWARLAAKTSNWSRISVSHASRTDNISAHLRGHLTMVLWIMQEMGFTAWGRLSYGRASTHRSNLKADLMENEDKFMDNWSSKHGWRH